VCVPRSTREPPRRFKYGRPRQTLLQAGEDEPRIEREPITAENVDAAMGEAEDELDH
jgi:hypothetical protein